MPVQSAPSLHTQPSDPEWSCPRGRFRFKTWGDDDEALVFDSGSGDTHLVEPLAMELLRVLDAGAPRRVASLAAELREGFADLPEAEVVERVRLCLEGLRALGLVSREPA